MKIHIAVEGSVGRAIEQVLGLLGDKAVFTDLSEASMVIVDGKEQLLKLYDAGKQFFVVGLHEPKNLPENAKWAPIHGLVVQLFTHVAKEDQSASSAGSAQASVPADIVRLKGDGAHRVLVIDDTADHREGAKQLASVSSQLTIASTYDQAMTLLKAETFDVVLTDLYLPMSRYHGALSVDVIRIGETVPYGILIALEAAKGGAAAAIVTDANHHQDCFSAAFDELREYVVNGRRVRFFNNIGKDWMRALTKLRE